MDSKTFILLLLFTVSDEYLTFKYVDDTYIVIPAAIQKLFFLCTNVMRVY